jgi:hypothetical protein
MHATQGRLTATPKRHRHRGTETQRRQITAREAAQIRELRVDPANDRCVLSSGDEIGFRDVAVWKKIPE